MPNTSPALAFRLKGQNAYIMGTDKEILPRATFSGLRKSVRLIYYTKDTATFIVLFKTTGASSFLKAPLQEFYEQSISLDRLISPEMVSNVEDQLCDARDNLQRVAIVERFLLNNLYPFRPDRLISTAIKKIHITKGTIRIQELADALFISKDAFEKRFRKIVGSSPKQFASIVRLSSLINEKRSKQSLTDVALNAGYYDQAHFIGNFKQFTGQTPRNFFKSGSFW